MEKIVKDSEETKKFHGLFKGVLTLFKGVAHYVHIFPEFCCE